MKVPMPGHFVVEDQIEPTLNDLVTLENEIKEHDIMLNCFDSREARYFPALIGSLYRKKVFSIGIGYDSYVIVNHGLYGENIEQCIKDSIEKDNHSLEQEPDVKANLHGCFFCSDYIPPSDTMTNRTMDQQCTVSRPGVSMISCGIAIEIIVNSLHDKKIGPVPTFVRGVVGGNFELQKFDNSRYENCNACSPLVLREYVRD